MNWIHFLKYTNWTWALVGFNIVAFRAKVLYSYLWWRNRSLVMHVRMSVLSRLVRVSYSPWFLLRYLPCKLWTHATMSMEPSAKFLRFWIPYNVIFVFLRFCLFMVHNCFWFQLTLENWVIPLYGIIPACDRTGEMNTERWTYDVFSRSNG